MRAVAIVLWGETSLASRRVAVQGVGKVGASLVRLLAYEGAEVLIADTDQRAVEAVRRETGARELNPDEILSTQCDILSPCALGGVLGEQNARELRCAAIVGSANNQLTAPVVADALAGRGILYAPDFVANAGGIINISVEREPGGYDVEIARAKVDGIFDRLTQILAEAQASSSTPQDVAVRLARDRIHQAEIPPA